jgi:Thioesterase superfamily
MSAPLSGIEMGRAMIAGDIAPMAMAQTLGVTLKEAGEGAAVFEGEPCGCAAHTTLPAGEGYTTVETKTNFVRAIKLDTRLVRAEGKVIAAGRTIMTTEARIYDAQRRVLAHGTSTSLVLRKE